MSLFDEIHRRLREPEGPDPQGNHLAWCPFHPDGKGKPPHRKSLSVHPTKGFHCFACMAKGSIRRLAQMLHVENSPTKKSRIVAAYDYQDEQGELLFQVVRYEPKNFKQRRPDGNGGWIYDIKGVRRVPYRLPQLLASNDKQVFIVEGEKDADSLARIGLVATTNPGGAGKWKEEHNNFFKGRDVILLADNDKLGRSHVADVARHLVSLTSCLKIVELPSLPPKGDVSDWIEAGHTLNELEELISRVPVIVRSPTNTDSGDPMGASAATPAFPSEDCPYTVAGGRICYLKRGNGDESDIPVRLCNFTAWVVTEVFHDDGSNAEPRHTLEIEGSLSDGVPLPKILIPVSEFSQMHWPVGRWGIRASVSAGMGAKDKLREAIQRLSMNASRKYRYVHTGWRNISGQSVYLSAGAVIGANGVVGDVDVELQGSLSFFNLPAPPALNQRPGLIRKVLQLLEVAPTSIMYPLLAAVFRAVLDSADFSIHVSGKTNVGKSELAALMQQFFGREMTARNLPGSWSSTGNALETIAFTAKDALLVVDDFAPTGSVHDVHRYHREADRVFRAQGNSSGRLRLRPDSSLMAARPPRGIILSTGEDVPRGQSLRGRLMVLEMKPTDLNWQALGLRQAEARSGIYASVLAGYLMWLAPRLDELRQGFRERMEALRMKAQASCLHKRTPEIVANLMMGFECFLAFAKSSKAITEEEEAALSAECWKALGEAALRQRKYLLESDPARRFLELVAAAVASGEAHLASKHGGAPERAGAVGWRREEGMSEMSEKLRPQGKRIGWLTEEGLLLEKEASFSLACAMAQRGEGSLGITSQTLGRHLREGGYLSSWKEARETNYIRRVLEGAERDVYHLSPRSLGLSGAIDPDRSDISGELKELTVGTVGDNRPRDSKECVSDAPTAPQDAGLRRIEAGNGSCEGGSLIPADGAGAAEPSGSRAEGGLASARSPQAEAALRLAEEYRGRRGNLPPTRRPRMLEEHDPGWTLDPDELDPDEEVKG